MYDFLQQKEDEAANGHSWINFLLGMEKNPWVARKQQLPDSNAPHLVDQKALEANTNPQLLAAMQAPMEQFAAQQMAKQAAMGDPNTQSEVHGIASMQMAPKTSVQLFNKPMEAASMYQAPAMQNAASFMQMAPVKAPMGQTVQTAYNAMPMTRPVAVVSGKEKAKNRVGAKFDY